MAGISVFLAVLLSVTWFLVTSGITAAPRLLFSNPPHTVELTWAASTTPGVTYNIYRRNESTGKYERLNTTPITGLAFTDPHPANGVTYTYFATAVAGATESARSNPASAKIPLS
jgi:titin